MSHSIETHRRYYEGLDTRQGAAEAHKIVKEMINSNDQKTKKRKSCTDEGTKGSRVKPLVYVCTYPRLTFI